MLFIFLFLLIFVKNTYAVENFNIKQNIFYEIEESGDGFVTQKVNLINNIPEIYPTEYQFNLFGSNLENISATDQIGNILQNISQEGENTIANLKFNKPVVGKNQENFFEIKYKVPKLAERKGKILEISLPEYKNIGPENSINITILIPVTFGKLSFSSVVAPHIIVQNNYTKIEINTNQIKDKKIMFTFGDFQLFDFNLTYELNNPENKIVTTQIPIPPDNDSQKIIYKDINPLPKQIDIDSDGNWLASYSLGPNQKIKITVSGQAKIISNTIHQENIDWQKLTSEQNFWPVSDSNIANISINLDTPKKIYDYTVSTLSYNFEGISTATRQGALETLLNPNKALCTEFTDLFITLARSKNIPAREIQGFAYTTNQKLKPVNLNTDILHAWPQYYDQNSKNWISIDPTWEKTTNGIDYFHDLDLNHFIFVIHGHDSQLPLSPGSYKFDTNTKTVNVEFAQEQILPTNSALILGANKNFLLIKNPNNVPFYNKKVYSSKLKYEKNIPFIPPFSTTKIELPKLNFLNSLLNQKIILQIDNTKHTVILPNAYRNLILIIGSLVIILCLGGIIISSYEKNS